MIHPPPSRVPTCAVTVDLSVFQKLDPDTPPPLRVRDPPPLSRKGSPSLTRKGPPLPNDPIGLGLLYGKPIGFSRARSGPPPLLVRDPPPLRVWDPPPLRVRDPRVRIDFEKKKDQTVTPLGHKAAAGIDGSRADPLLAPYGRPRRRHC